MKQLRDLGFFFFLLIIPATCVVMVEKENTKQKHICSEYLLRCGELNKKCEC